MDFDKVASNHNYNLTQSYRVLVARTTEKKVGKVENCHNGSKTKFSEKLRLSAFF